MFSPSKGEGEIFSHSPPLGNEAYFAIVGEEREEGNLGPSSQKGKYWQFLAVVVGRGRCYKVKKLSREPGRTTTPAENERNSDRNRQFCPPPPPSHPPPLLLATPYHACSVRAGPFLRPKRAGYPTNHSPFLRGRFSPWDPLLSVLSLGRRKCVTTPQDQSGGGQQKQELM